MFQRILIASDGSKHSEFAARVGVELAKMSGGRVTAVYVVDKARTSISESGYDVAPDIADGTRLGLQKEGMNAVSYIENLAKSSGVGFESKILVGNPANEILKESEKNLIDSIVIGSIGQTGITKFLLGSVAEKIVRGSKIPVIVVPGA
ncbi:MAG: universal stress protein [Methanotrichaceae archaeon]